MCLYSAHIYIYSMNDIIYNTTWRRLRQLCSCVRGARGRRRQTGVGSEITLTPTRCHLTLSDNQCKDGCKTDPNLYYLSTSSPASPTHPTPTIHYIYIPYTYTRDPSVGSAVYIIRAMYAYLYTPPQSYPAPDPLQQPAEDHHQYRRRICNARDRFSSDTLLLISCGEYVFNVRYSRRPFD